MKRFKSVLFSIAIMASFFVSNRAEAFNEGDRYDVRICIERYPDGTAGIGSGCVYPDPTGPCTRTTDCNNVVIQE